jgi:hypothetical protein
VLPLLQHCLVDTWFRGRGGGQQWPRIAQLRVFAVTAAAQQPTPAATAQQQPLPTAVGQQPTPVDVVQHPSTTPAADDDAGLALGAHHLATRLEGFAPKPSSSMSSSSVGSTLQEQQHCGSGPGDQDKVLSSPSPVQQQEVWAELWVRGLSPGALAAIAAFVASRSPSLSTQQGSSAVMGSSTGTGLGAMQPGGAGNTGQQLRPEDCRKQPLAAGAAGAALNETSEYLRQHSASGGWLPERQRDAAELLLRHGLARLAEAEDVEWLGMRQSRWTAYCRLVRTRW